MSKTIKISLDNLHTIAKSHPEDYKKYMQRLNPEQQSKVVENAARSRVGYEGLNNVMYSAVGGVPSLVGDVVASSVDYAVQKTTGKDSWGDLLYSGDNKVIKTIANASNPANLIGALSSLDDVVATSLMKNSSASQDIGSAIIKNSKTLDVEDLKRLPKVLRESGSSNTLKEGVKVYSEDIASKNQDIDTAVDEVARLSGGGVIKKRKYKND